MPGPLLTSDESVDMDARAVGETDEELEDVEAAEEADDDKVVADGEEEEEREEPAPYDK